MADEPSEEAKNEKIDEEKQQAKEPSTIGLHDLFNLKQQSPNFYDLRPTEKYKNPIDWAPVHHQVMDDIKCKLFVHFRLSGK